MPTICRHKINNLFHNYIALLLHGGTNLLNRLIFNAYNMLLLLTVTVDLNVLYSFALSRVRFNLS